MSDPMTDPTDTEDGIADIERLRGGGTTVTCGNCANAYDEGYTAGHNAENARLREQAEALATALEELSEEVWPTECDAEMGEPNEDTRVAGQVYGGTIVQARAALRAYRGQP